MHCCDANCDERIFYDNGRTICRLSRRIVDIPRGEGGMAHVPALARPGSAAELGAPYSGRDSPGFSSGADSWGSFKRRSTSIADALSERDVGMGDGDTSESKRARPATHATFLRSPSASPLGGPHMS